MHQFQLCYVSKYAAYILEYKVMKNTDNSSNIFYIQMKVYILEISVDTMTILLEFDTFPNAFY